MIKLIETLKKISLIEYKFNKKHLIYLINILRRINVKIICTMVANKYSGFTKKLCKTCMCQYQFSRSVMSNSATPWTAAHYCLSPAPGVCSTSCPLSRWGHSPISSSVIPFSSHLQSFPASGYFPMSQFFASGGQRIGVSASASVLPMNIQDSFPLWWTGLISLQSKGLSRVFSNTTLQKYLFFSAQLSL